MSQPAPRPATTALLIALLCAIWGSTWIVIRAGLEDLPPFTSAAIRFALAALVMCGVAAALARREGGTPAPPWLVLTMGALNIATSFGAVYWAEQSLPSGLASVLFAVFPLLMAIAGHLALPGERLSWMHAAGFALGFSGVALLFHTDVALAGPGAGRAALVFLLSPVAVAIGTTCVKRYGGAVSSLKLNRDAMVVGAVLLALLAVAFERGRPVALTPRAIGSILYLALIGTVLTFAVYYWLLRSTPAYKLSIIPFVTPLVALALGAAFAGETVRASTVAGAALVFSGIAAVMLARRPAVPEDTARRSA